MNSKKLNKINKQNLEQSFIALASVKLTSKEKKVLAFLSSREFFKNATQTVNELSLLLGCAQSTSWSVLRSLRSLKLINYENNGTVLELSASARLLVSGGLE